MEKMPLIHSVMPALVLPLWFIGCACLASGGQLQFSGSVITAACWNETGTSDILCQCQDRLERHITVENLIVPISSPYATIEKSYLDEDKQLTLLRVVYD
ncbi:TPA: hypothetical protein NEF91_003001 [Klebsiella oxytoca]|uniref:hypothetical protein n=1 Tax=Klebsiella oxytoca TaxID=571 RepID=UPI001A35C578|nr:hypothetical protein [Klebsiella oxytoca]MCW9611052.1 hypothetical protein [Klebsiella oxytoca]MCW9678650.1 hypothetical protein [Klebsiella oxytoca]HAT1653783.1 hypothetical protein [Klebsiella oxytoca]HAT2832455.1 hypothetical protein [Klebsiella oxytoca]HBC5493547.1 hypothetical protein [Klebsiella oxytoca]